MEDFDRLKEQKTKMLKENTIDGLLEFFKEQEVAIQITLDLKEQPTVHALFRDELDEKNVIKMTEGDTVLHALKLMKVKLFG